jgi:hypothetical protein
VAERGKRSNSSNHVKLLLDMNLSPVWATILREAGFESVHWSQVGKPTASDKEIFDWLLSMDMSSSRTILTLAQFSPIRLPAGPPLFKFERTIFRPNCCRESWLGHFEIPPASLRRGLLSRLICLDRVFDFCPWTRSSVHRRTGGSQTEVFIR